MAGASHESDAAELAGGARRAVTAPTVTADAVSHGRRSPRALIRVFLGVPPEWFQRVRRAFLLLSLIALVLAVYMLRMTPEAERLWIGVSFPSLIWLACRWIQEYRRPSISPFWDCADGLALLLASMGLERLDSSTGFVFLFLLYSSLAFRSLSINPRRVAIGVLVYLIVYLSAIAFDRSIAVIEQASAMVMVPIPGLIMVGVVGHLLAVTLAERDLADWRQRRFVHGIAELMNSSDQSVVSRRIATIARSFCQEAPDVITAVVSGRASDLSVVAVAGQRDDVPCNHFGMEHLPPIVMDCIPRGQAITLSGADAKRVAGLLELPFASPWVFLVPIDTDHHVVSFLCVAGNDRLTAGCIEDITQFSHHFSTAWKHARESEDLRQRESTFRSLVQHSSDAITVLSSDFTIIYQTPVLGRMLGVEVGSLVGLSLLELIHPEDLAAAIAFLEALVDQCNELPPAEWRLQCADGSWLPVETTGANLLNDSQITGLLLTSRDISDRRLLEDRLRHEAFHDPLTGLPNRALFLQQLETGLARPLRRSVSHAVMFLDLDRFKTINDSLGHEAGDQLLRTVADRLRECAREDDLVARLGGDEFAILLDDIIDDVPAIEIAERILHRMTEPIYLGGHEVAVTTSIGIALGSAPYDTPDRMLRDADVAMYEAKGHGKACFTIFSAEMNAHALERLTLESELRNCVRYGQLDVHYQPLVSIESGHIQEVEALVRWNHPRLGLLSPAEFIGLAEETGLILPIGQWVLYEACRQVRNWHEDQARNPLSLSVNLSARQFQQPGLVSEIASILKEAGLPPRSLQIEITESVAMIDQQATIEMLHELRGLGVRLAIDDFGIGYSSLSSLKHFPVDALKIDRAFVAGLGYDTGDTAIVGAVIAFAKALQLSVTAEGIETMQQLLRLRALKCDQGQGYLFAKPLDYLNLEPLLSKPRLPGHDARQRQTDRLRLVTVEHGVA